MIYLVRAMRGGGLQNAELLGFGPIRLCTDNVVGFVQMLQCFDIFASWKLSRPARYCC
jgi:hypothetical protein